MKKFVTAILIFIIFIIVRLNYCYGVEEAFEVKMIEIVKNETLEMTINMGEIKYNKFKFELLSDRELENIEIDTEVDIEQIANEILIEVDKENTNLSKITLYYTPSNDIEIGDKIKLTAIITNLENEEEKEIIEKEVSIIEEKQEDNKKEENKQDETEKTIYKDIDKQLENAIERFNNMPIIERSEDYFKKNNDKKTINPRLIIIERDKDGAIQNKESLGNLSNYENDIKFNKSNLNNIYNLQISGEYKYRCINFETIQNGENIYIQVLANVDGEAGSLRNILNILSLGTAILVLISIILSYILSKRAMKPIIDAYEKQTEFVQNASHELRTPLAIIQLKQELLLTEPNKKIIDKSEDINLTLKETKRLTKLIKELMDLARADTTKEILNKELINLNDLIKEISKPYVELAQIQEKTIEFDLKYNKEIKLDKNKINELLIIILDNALKYTNKDDKILIKTYQKEGKCNIEIQDTGIGISEDGLKHIFDRFYREDKARTRENGGNGLGLSIAKTIVNLHNGTIKAVHNEPKGTIIKIKI